MHTKRATSTLALVLLLGTVLSGQAFGQCILANPSFEIAGSGGADFVETRRVTLIR
jgi:hypothetical protein